MNHLQVFCKQHALWELKAMFTHQDLTVRGDVWGLISGTHVTFLVPWPDLPLHSFMKMVHL